MSLRSSPRRALPLLLLLRLVVPLIGPLLLAACGDLPEPFLGNPGATARRLAVPITPMLAVPRPSHALLPKQAEDDFADLLALSLQKEEVPSLAREPHKTDWRLAVSAGRKGDLVVPRYAILDPAGRETGAIDGAAVPAAGWTAGAPWTLGAAARDAVPKILALMMSVRATRDRANPNSLLNRAAKLYVPLVTGAPGDGDPALTRMIRARLAEFGPLVQVTPEGADFTVTGHVTVSPLPKGQQQVEIAWTVTRPSGAVVGKVSQLNSVAAGSLDQFWGDVAGVVAQEASGGINTVVERFIGREDAEAGTGSGSTGPGTGAGPAQGAVAGKTTVPTGGAAASNASPSGREAAPAKATALGQNGNSGKATAPGGGAASGMDTVAGKGTSQGRATVSKEAIPGKGTVLGKDAAAGKSTSQSQTTAPKGAVPGKGIVPGKATPQGQATVSGAAVPGKGTVPGKDTAAGKSTTQGQATVSRTAVPGKGTVAGKDAVPGKDTTPGKGTNARGTVPGKAIAPRGGTGAGMPADPAAK
jgi:hypothetical protein